METFEGACRRKALEVAELVISKQKDYGQNNILDFGELGVLIRLNDKVARLKNLWGKKPTNESLTDTWMDIVGYGLIALMLKDNSFTNPLEGK